MSATARPWRTPRLHHEGLGDQLVRNDPDDADPSASGADPEIDPAPVHPDGVPYLRGISLPDPASFVSRGSIAPSEATATPP